MVVGAIAGVAIQVNFTLTTPAASAVENTAHELAFAGPDRYPAPFTLTAWIVTGVTVPAELMTPAEDVQPPDVGEAPLNLNFTAVVATPVAVSFGLNLPVPLILHETEPEALRGTAPLTPSPITVTVVMASTKTAPIPTNLRSIIFPHSAAAGI